MGYVAVKMSITLEGPEVDLGKVKEEIRKRVQDVREITEKPIAFGLKMLEVLLVFKDEPGGTDKIESIIADISGVASVECGDITLI